VQLGDVSERESHMVLGVVEGETKKDERKKEKRKGRVLATVITGMIAYCCLLTDGLSCWRQGDVTTSRILPSQHIGAGDGCHTIDNLAVAWVVSSTPKFFLFLFSFLR